MESHKSSRAIIIVPIDDVYRSVRQLFKSELPATWFDNNEVDEIITTIFNVAISSILNNIGFKTSDTYKECYQGNIDYLEYCGISQNSAFRIVHMSEMGILKSIFTTCPFLDDEKILKIVEYKFLYMTDLHIIVEFKQPNIYEQNTNHSNTSYPGSL